MPMKIHQSELMTRPERRRKGKALRKQVPLASHGDWAPAADRPDPIRLLQAQDQDRVKHLLPIKYGRMLVSPFAFFRGSAAVMAADVGSTPVTGIDAMLCGDAHLSNFGAFATPERRMVFDVNDFDEAFPGPWEWDLKRLAASAVIAGRDNGFSETKCRQLAVDAAAAYADTMDRFSKMQTLEHWYYDVDVASVLKVFQKSSRKGQRSAAKMVKKAKTRTHEETLEKLTRRQNGARRIISDPPLLVPFGETSLEEYLSKTDRNRFSEDRIEQDWREYLNSLPDDRRYLLQRFQIIDGALRVGGIGSVGTRCAIVLLKGGAKDDMLLLQIKEAGPSILQAHVNTQSRYDNHAQRVVTAQRLMQATSDIFLGWHRSTTFGTDFYWRQLKDMKGSFDVAGLDEAGLQTKLTFCSYCLARAHARTGDEVQIRGYVGKRDTFATAIGDFAVKYADQTERDYEALVAAVKSGRIAAETGI